VVVIINTALFPWLFYHHSIGLNLLLFNLLVLSGLYITDKLDLKSSLNRYISAGTLLTAFFVVYNGSDLAIAVNILSLFFLAGTELFPKGRNLFYTSLISFVNFFSAQLSFTSLTRGLTSGMKKFKVFSLLKLILIPLGIVLLFMLMYKTANPVFEGLVKSFFDAIESFFIWFFKLIDVALIMTVIFGFVLSNYFFLGESNQFIAGLDESSSDQLNRKRKKVISEFNSTGLKNEYKSAIILFALLNLLILVINLIDVWWVWFNFEWSGEYLKQFVHEGTYILILSILISLAISIFYFRGNINFLKNNRLLKYLAYVWLGQNAILTLSVGIRNFWYIHYFSLAYLRIGVVFFLLLTLFSIYTVYVKIRDKKTTYYLFRKNALAAYVLLITMAFFNWDIIIVRYNFSHAETAFIHFDFLASLSDNALPYLEKSEAELAEIDKFQRERFPFREQYLSSEQYADRIGVRKQNFLQSWQERSWQEWNFAGERAYRKLTE